ncbi:hypothetical protein [Salinigranum sp.]|uniref:hypothetical protein n=1 Tax=Salinigranum sp. TaxID=1966351 RepID=UPI0035692213
MFEPSTGRDDEHDEERDRLPLAAIVAGGIVVLLYSVLVAGQILAPIALFAWVFVVYLLWRFVRAHERLADAAERLAADGPPARARDRDHGRGRRRGLTDGNSGSPEE